MLLVEMGVVYDLGENRFQLSCVCGHEFTYSLTDKINSDRMGRAKCPECAAVWNGERDEITSVRYKTAYYALYVRMKREDEELYRLFAIGTGVSLLHFALPMMTQVKLQLNVEPDSMMIETITRQEFDLFRDIIRRQGEIEPKRIAKEVLF